MAVDYTRLLGVFLSEAAEQIERLNDCVLALERTPDDSALYDEILRHAHSLKGGAASFGIHDLTNLSHEFESYVVRLRQSPLLPSSEQVDMMLAALDALQVFVNLSTRGGSETNDPLVEDARHVIDRLRQTDESVSLTGPSPAGGRARAFPSAATVAEAERLASGGALVHQLEVRFHEEMKMISVRLYLLMSNLERVARVLESTPARDSLSDAHFDGSFRALVVLESGVKLDVLEERGMDDAGASRGMDDAGASSSRFLKVEIGRIDGLLHLASELVTSRNELYEYFLLLRDRLTRREIRLFEELLDRQEQHMSHLRDDVLRIRMVPVRELFQRFPRIVRDVARETGKQVVFEMSGEETELDKKLVDRLADPLVHLLRNAVDHGIEPANEREDGGKTATGTVRLEARQQGHSIFIELSDDGRGIEPATIRKRVTDCGMASVDALERMSDDEVLEFLFLPGFSTRDQVTEVSGRGVGLDVVREQLKALNGRVTLHSRPGEGCSFILQMPLTQAVATVLLVEVCEEVYALPVRAVLGTFLSTRVSETTLEGRSRFLTIEGRPVPLFDLAALLGAERNMVPGPDEARPTVLVDCRDKRAAVIVDRFVGQEDLVIKSLSEHYRDVNGITGASILVDGRVVLIVDVATVVGSKLHSGGEGRVSLA